MEKIIVSGDFIGFREIVQKFLDAGYTVVPTTLVVSISDNIERWAVVLKKD